MRIILSGMLLCLSVQGQSLSWSQVQTSSAPPARYGAGMVFDVARQAIVMCGGESSPIPLTPPNLLTDTWRFSSGQWSLSSPQVFPHPSTAGFAAVTYDSLRQKTVAWLRGSSGGILGGAAAWGGLHEWDGLSWTNFIGGPLGLSPSSVAYDQARAEVVLFGGGGGVWWLGSGQNAMWAWDGASFTQKWPVSMPPARLLHAMAYDFARQRIVLFGGCVSAISTTSFADTWEWDGANWMQANPLVSPVARRGHAMAFNPSRNRVVLFGGAANAPLGYFSDTWEWDGVNWTLVPVQAAPQGRWGHSMAYEASTGRMVVFGGTFDQGPLNDTWVLPDVPPLLAQATVYGSGCGAPPLVLTPDAAARPVLGTLAGATISNAPTPLAGVAMGWSNTVSFPVTLPFELSGVGMPGCFLWQSLQLFGLTTAPVGPSSLRFTYPIPASPIFNGVRVYIQAYCYAPGANSAEIVLSNGVEWELGGL